MARTEQPSAPAKTMHSRFTILAALGLSTYLLAGCGTAPSPSPSPQPPAGCQEQRGVVTRCVDEPGPQPAHGAGDQAAPTEALIFGLSATVQLPAPLSGAPFHLQPGDPLPTGARLVFTVQASVDAHLYAFQMAPGGEVSVLFPSVPLQVANPLRQGGARRLPPGDGSFRLNDQDLGVTHLYVVVSVTPLAELDAALAGVGDGTVRTVANSPALEKVARVVPVAQADSCLPFDWAAPGGEGCRRPVGDNLRASLTAGQAPGGIEGGSLLLRAPTGQGLIVAVLPFEHLSLAKYQSLPPAARSRGIIMED